MAAEEFRWQCVTESAQFPGMDGSGAVMLNGKMFLLGGWNPNDKINFPDPPPGPWWQHRQPYHCNSRVYSSADGEHWEVACEQAPWCGRHTAGYAVLRDRMFVVGGDPGQGPARLLPL